MPLASVQDAQPIRKLCRGRARNLLAQRRRNAAKQLAGSFFHPKRSSLGSVVKHCLCTTLVWGSNPGSNPTTGNEPILFQTDSTLIQHCLWNLGEVRSNAKGGKFLALEPLFWHSKALLEIPWEPTPFPRASAPA